MDLNRQQLRRVVGALRTDQGRRALRLGVAATVVPQHTLRRVRPDVIIDVGANKGQFLLDARTAVPEARCIAFEPLPSEFAVLETVHGNDPQVDLRPVAIADSEGVATLHVSAAADSSSLLKISPRQNEMFPGTAEVDEIDVPVSTLDAQLDDVALTRRSFVKIDVQGGELDVLKGGTHTLTRVGYVYVEASFVELYQAQPLIGDVNRYLCEHGFSLDHVSHLSTVKGVPVQADFLYRHSDI